MPSHTLEIDAILFDMDGTLINSTPAVNGVWEDFAKKYDLNLKQMLSDSHGVQTHMTFRKYLPHLTDEERAAEVVNFEKGIIPMATKLQAEGKEGLNVLPGVPAVLSQLRAGRSTGYAIVTSATSAYAEAALGMLSDQLGELPKVIVTADDVPKGKPNPDPYLEGAKRLGLDITKCLVVEDAPSGARAGLAAGSEVLAVGTGHDVPAIKAVNPTYFVADLTQVSVEWKGEKLFVTINEA
ncbi:Predicted haloacid-halidohydrolase and related hydrolases [Phaffia rhodozyma]|uniref:Predicted haloacid-halidohydrolase and related hydrolases n=1 Tax=Phaffia rhodozyma TaxID=264483 RepID=A0A0F7SPW7_PHARH|nr:Predicted haloacid-halidohydrolase and related hydrolases [Phaffia rhodozyma]